MHGRRHKGHSRATRALIALVAVVACLGSVAYAATRPAGERSRVDRVGQAARGPGQGPPRPRFIEVPPASFVGDGFQFRFHVPPPAQPPSRATPGPAGAPRTRWRRFLCRLDGGDWAGCASPLALPRLDAGEHSFAVRALSPRGRPGLAAHYRWLQLRPMDFTIDPQMGSLDELMPGAPAQPLPVRIGNPNPVPIEVTGLTVAVAPDPPGCPGDPNFAITPSDLTPAAPLSIAAGGFADLPAAMAPTLAMREMPIDQNACQGADIPLVFSGEARG